VRVDVVVRMAAAHCRQPTVVHEREDPSDLESKIEYALTEARMVLPGAQALPGFQFIAFLNPCASR